MTSIASTILVYAGAAVAEIAGCFAFWAWLRLGKTVFWLILGMGSLALFAYLLTLVEGDAAGRAYATYGGIYIVASLVWMWLVEGQRPRLTQFIWTGIAITGATGVIGL